MNVHSEKILDWTTKKKCFRLYHQKEVMKYFKCYVRHSKAWYSHVMRGIEVDIVISPDEGASSEMRVKWIDVDGDLCAKLECFEDSWKALDKFKPLFKKMAEIQGEKIQEDDFCQMLNSLGFKDLTEYTNPCPAKHKRK